MKKSGFTLAELLISLGITGVIAALMTTALVTLQPDQKKAIYLRNYDALTKAVKALAGNSKLFPVCQDNLNCQAHPLFNTATGIDGRFASIGAGDGKLCKGLSYMMNGQMLPQLNCESQPIAYSDGNWTPSFRTYRTEWLVSTLRELNGSSATYQSDVYFDLNGPEGPNCIYSDSCQNPDRFKFLVAADGTVIPADPVGQEYISKRKNWRKSKLSIAEDSTTKENLLASLRTFSLTPCHEESSGNNDNGDDYPDHDYHYTIMPCGAKFDGKIINCFSAKIVYPGLYVWVPSDTPFPEEPLRIFGPTLYEFDYPVASNITLERNVNGPLITFWATSGNGGSTDFGYTNRFLQKAVITKGMATGASNQILCTYDRRDCSNAITSYKYIMDTASSSVGKDRASISVAGYERFDNIKYLRYPNIGYYCTQGYICALSRVTPLADTQYIYLEKQYQEDGQYYSVDIGELYYLRYGEIYVDGNKLSQLVNDIWNIDSSYTNRHKKYIKEALNNGNNVQVFNFYKKDGNDSYIDAKLLDFTKK